HKRLAAHEILECLEVHLRLAGEVHHGEHGHLVAKTLFIKQRPIALDIARALERAHAAQAWWRRDADPARQLDIGETAVVLQLLEDFAVDGIESCGQRRPPDSFEGLYYPHSGRRETILRIKGIFIRQSRSCARCSAKLA